MMHACFTFFDQNVANQQRKNVVMKKTFFISIVLWMAGFVHQTHAELQVGDSAPDFSLLGSDGKSYKLSDFVGKQAVVIAWFPKAFTGG